MSRYIDAEELEVDSEWNDVADYYTAVSMAQINATPTADVVEVVRCKDCEWNKSTPHNPICSNDDMPKDVGFFCADGERRDDEIQGKK